MKNNKRADELKNEIFLINKELEAIRKEIKPSSLDVPYVPSSHEKVGKMIELANIKKGIKAADLGSGDGRVVIALANAGAFAYGFELESDRVRIGRENIEKAGLSDRAFIRAGDYFKANLKPYDLIMVYGLTSIMPRLEEKLMKELEPGARIVSNRFTFPNWQPEKEIDEVYLYIKK